MIKEEYKNLKKFDIVKSLHEEYIITQEFPNVHTVLFNKPFVKNYTLTADEALTYTIVKDRVLSVKDLISKLTYGEGDAKSSDLSNFIVTLYTPIQNNKNIYRKRTYFYITSIADIKRSIFLVNAKVYHYKHVAEISKWKLTYDRDVILALNYWHLVNISKNTIKGLGFDEDTLVEDGYQIF